MAAVKLGENFFHAYPFAGHKGRGKVQKVGRLPDNLVAGFGGADFPGFFGYLFADQFVVQRRRIGTGDGITEPFRDKRLKVFPGIAAPDAESGPVAGMADRAGGIHDGKQRVPVTVRPEPAEDQNIA
jgi:hypothetical protein